MASHYNLRCLGTAELRSPGGDLVRLRTRKHFALLVFLSVEPRITHRRERLADLLWPGASAAEGRHSLATALSVLRGRFGPEGFETGRDHVRFACTEIDLDLDRLARGDVLESDVVPALDVAPFLEDFEIEDAPEFQLWRDGQQARWLPAIRDALVKLMDRCRRTGDFRRIEGLADRMVRIDGLSEEGIRAKMEARAFSGDRLTALKIFEAWKTRLNEELGAAPSSLIEGIAIRLRRRGWERTTTVEIPPVPTDQWKHCPFIGRTVEYQVLYEAWEATGRGHGSHVLLLGDSGIGKSTLLERLTTAAGLEGAATARVQCYEPERDIPYAALSGLVHGMLERPGASGTPPEWLAELARAMPEVRQRFPTVPQAPESHGETARLRLAEGVHQLLTAVAEESPVILVVDDIHLADDASVSVLHLLMRRTQRQRIMVLAAARGGELMRTPSAGRLRDNQGQLGLAIVELPPMSVSESHELLGSLLPPEASPPGATVHRAIVRAAAGYPMVMELLLRDWQVHGERCLALAVDAMTADPGSTGAAEDAYRRILERLILELDPPTRNVLNLAAILGTRLNDLGMYTLVDLSFGQTMTGLAQLTDRRLLRDGGQELEFRNELIRAQAYLGVPSPLRKVLHGQVADRLLASAREGVAVPGLEIAWHCIRSGRMDEATPYLLSGAREAMQHGAVHEAELGLATALDHLSEPRKSEALLLLSEVMQEQARWSESLELLERVDASGNPERSELRQVFLLYAQRFLNDFPSRDRVGFVRELLRLIRDGTGSRVRTCAAIAVASVLDDLRDSRLSEQALRTIEELIVEPESEDFANLTLAKAMVLYQVRKTSSSMAHILQAASLLSSKGADYSVTARLDWGIGANYISLGQYLEAIPYLRKAFNTAQRIGNDRLIVSTASNLALCLGRTGQYVEAASWGEAALLAKGRHYHGYSGINAALVTAHAYAMMHDSSKSLLVLSNGGRGTQVCETPWIQQAWELGSADVLQLLGKQAEAVDTATTATAGHKFELHSTAFVGQFARWFVFTATSLSEMNMAAERMDGWLGSLEEFDVKDQAEILIASSLLTLKSGGDNRPLLRRVWGALGSLPEAFTQQMQRLGVLQVSEDALGLPDSAVTPAHSR
jgi:DNA-binding SARP family transcriptional activator/tetratricopeptide (TPR) repeat protein